MKNIFLSPTDIKADLTLEPTEDTLYVLPQGLATASLVINLAVPDVRAFVLGLFRTQGEQTLTIAQNHLAPRTESHIVLKTLVAGESSFSYQGNIAIAKEAPESNASQETRGLLLGEEARFKTIPSLEILPKNVVCHHKASSAPVNPDSVYTLKTKGFSRKEAEALLETAFLKSALDNLSAWGVPEAVITKIENSLHLE